MSEGPRFTSIDYARIEGHGDRVEVLCDLDRPDGGAALVGQTVDIDGARHLVLKVGDRRHDGAVRQGERLVLWVSDMAGQ